MKKPVPLIPKGSLLEYMEEEYVIGVVFIGVHILSFV